MGIGNRASGATKVLWLVVVCAALLVLPGLVAHAAPTTADQAAAVVKGWLSLDSEPLETPMGQQVSKVEAYDHADGGMSYYVVYLEPGGFVIVPGDDLVYPVIAFSPKGLYDPSEDNPMGALVTRDLGGRVAGARAQRLAGGQKAQNRWRKLEALAEDPSKGRGELAGIVSVSKVHVAPLVKSTWSQQTVSGLTCYNYFTPGNYPCGCVATALAQMMRFDRRPGKGVGKQSYQIWVNGVSQTRKLRGGNGKGGAYDWGGMVLQPTAAITKTQRKAIGALCHDAGVACHMRYTPTASTAYIADAQSALLNAFGYGNAIVAYHGATIPKRQLYRMLNASVAARRPTMLGVYRVGGGHAIVCDGYGYHSGKMYHHVNMGWGGLDNAWYKLPTVDASYTYTTIENVLYNVAKSGSGEIISGRVTDKNGNPIKGAVVAATRAGAKAKKKRTNARGMYGFLNLPSKTAFTLKCSKKGHKFQTVKTSTGLSKDGTATCGNVWNANFKSSKALSELSESPPDGC